MKKDDALTRARVLGVPWWRRAIAWFRGRGLKALPAPPARATKHPFSVMLPPRDVLGADLVATMRRVRDAQGRAPIAMPIPSGGVPRLG